METKRHPVNLKQYRKVNEKWQFVAVARDAKGNPDPRLILLNGHPVNSKGGTFYLDYKENGVRRQTAVGTNARDALEAWRTKLALLTGLIEPDAEMEDRSNAGLTIDQAIASYLTEVEATKGIRTFRQYRRELAWFRSHCRKRYVAELDRSDAMRLFVEGRKEIVDGRPLNQKTINRRIIIMLNAMRSQGAVIEMKKGDWPKTIDKKIEIYQPEELKKFLDACNPEERMIFQVFLCTGFREKEVSTLVWSDVHWKEGKLAVSAKPDLGFTPKSYEERTVPVPMGLIEALRERKKSSKSLLVFPTLPHPTRPDYGKGDNPDGHLLEMCKEIAFRAGLNCGHCKGVYTVYALSKGVAAKVKRHYKCDSAPRCGNWYLHKFRHTFATNILQSVDIRSLQVMLGHKNISTTEKYLKSLRLDQLRERIESSALAAYV
jgi:integrase/recombinase XerD